MPRLPGQRVGSLIAATFGLVYVLVNTAPLPAPWALTLRALGAVAFVAVLAAILRPGAPSAARGTDGPPVFGRRYWTVVGVESVALFAGARALSGPLHTPEAGVAWVSLVVGVHFFFLAALFRQRFFHGLGAVITACGVIGLVLAATGAPVAPIALVGGVLPGAVLLAFGWWGARRTAPDLDGPGPGRGAALV